MEDGESVDKQLDGDSQPIADSEKVPDSQKTDSQEDMHLLELAAYGCIIGAFVGDAAGAVLEFRRKISEEDVQKALTFPGGGNLDVSPGQITDDSEMAISLLRGILHSKEKELDPLLIAKEYLNWYKSGPFDIGATTAGGIK